MKKDDDYGGSVDTFEWDPTTLFSNADASSAVVFAVILLNQPIAEKHKKRFRAIWERATLRLCADGGANRLFDAFGDDGIALPHEVRGDLDSVRDDVREYYASKGVAIVKAASQYATDLQKCILRVEEEEQARAMRDDSDNTVTRLDVVILGGLSGRMDQTMHTLHVLCQLAPTAQGEQKERKDNVSSTGKNKGLNEEDFVTLDRRPRAWVMSENSLTWILSTGKHLITIDQSIFGPTCGLLPLMSQLHERGHSGTKIWTEGLEWDLDGTPSAVGGFLSTSNHLKNDRVTVRTEREIIWTMEIREDED